MLDFRGKINDKVASADVRTHANTLLVAQWALWGTSILTLMKATSTADGLRQMPAPRSQVQTELSAAVRHGRTKNATLFSRWRLLKTQKLSINASSRSSFERTGQHRTKLPN